jgi:hypothetical protein
VHRPSCRERLPNGDERAVLLHECHERVTEVLLRYLRATVRDAL